MVKLLVIGFGGFLGAIARYGISGLVHRHYQGALPAGTLIVNALGCLVIGSLMSLVEHRQLLSPQTRVFLMVGLLGSLTTFSTLGYETFELLRSGSYRLALGNVLANVVLGLGAVVLGWFAVKITAT